MCLPIDRNAVLLKSVHVVEVSTSEIAMVRNPPGAFAYRSMAADSTAIFS